MATPAHLGHFLSDIFIWGGRHERFELTVAGALSGRCCHQQRAGVQRLLSREEVDTALRRSEQTALGDERIMEDMTPANRDAVAFASRFLMLANNSASNTHTVGFHELARMVGETKGHYPDEQ